MGYLCDQFLQRLCGRAQSAAVSPCSELQRVLSLRTNAGRCALSLVAGVFCSWCWFCSQSWKGGLH